MKNKISMLFLFLLSSSLFLQAADIKDFLKNSSFIIGPEYVHIDLHSQATSIVDSMKFRGHAWGGTAAYEYKEANGIYFNLNGFYVSGHIHGNQENRHFSDERLEFRLGHIFVMDCSKKWKLVPYLGAGYARIVQSHITPAVLGLPYVTTKTPTYCIPVGAIISYEINDCFQIGTNIKWTPQVDATFKTSAIKDGRWTLNNKDGWLVEVPVTYREKVCDMATSVAITPYWRMLTKGMGTAVTSTGKLMPIPGQRYHFIGVKLLFGLSY